ncbi:response regulator [archaeon]|jgi:CheY-like chemotaxis protein|nr:response regulator [archaeon]MBT6761905.1 response regulator [archaeon]
MESPKDSSNKKILIVDDEKDIRELTKELLISWGYQVKTASDGMAAIDMLRKEVFDLVLLDILMPKMSGTETVQIIRKDQKLKDQKIAMFTVVMKNEDERILLKLLNITEYITKPFESQELKKRLKKILAE